MVISVLAGDSVNRGNLLDLESTSMNAEQWQAFGSIGSMLSGVAAVVGFGFIIINICVLNRTLRSNINGNLLQQSIGILKYIADKPYLYDYLYSDKSLSDTDPHKVEVLCLCEMALARESLLDSPMEGAGFEPSVPAKRRWFSLELSGLTPSVRETKLRKHGRPQHAPKSPQRNRKNASDPPRLAQAEARCVAIR
jgi:hypothetical protein